MVKVSFKPPPGTPGKAWPAILMGLFVAFGGVLFGYDTGTIGGIIAMDYWKEHFSTTGDGTITAAEDSLIVSILSAVSILRIILPDGVLIFALHRELSSALSQALLWPICLAAEWASCSPLA